jgi:hypothetical protein
MHCNRLMGPDLEKEKKALAYAHHLLLRIPHLLKKRNAQPEKYVVEHPLLV